MKVSTKKNDGVSPVIGTILLVAITVVLVAIISAVVMGMTSGVGTSHVVGVKVSQEANASGTSLLVTITGGDTSSLTDLAVYNGSKLVEAQAPEAVGVPMSFGSIAANLSKGMSSISIVGTFADGPQTIYTGTIYLE